MRTIGVLIITLLLLPSFQARKTIETKNNLFARQESTFRFHIPPTRFPSLNIENKKKADIDTNNLIQSGWYADVMKNIQESEYEIKSVNNTNEFASPNRAQNLRTFYSADKFLLQPRSDDSWKLQLKLKGVYSGQKKIYSMQKDAIVTTNKNKISFKHGQNFTVEYINSKDGVRQNFIIEKEPASKRKTLSIKLQSNKGWLINKVHSKEIHFAKTTVSGIEKKLTYNNLKVWDADNKELAAHFKVKQNVIEIIIEVENAVYPVTIDPLSSGISGTPDWVGDDADQANAVYGQSVASVGDINADGFSDVIIGATLFDDGANINEGRAFVYFGSASGLSSIPNNILDDADQAQAQFGYSVSTAGDINGDGYSDVIVGGYGYDDGAFSDEGRAFVYYGSLGGLSSIPDRILDDANQADAHFGWSVACVGDVNGDGFSDVIVGSPTFDDGFVNEGKAFLYYGSSSGLGTTPGSIPDDADQLSAGFGFSVAGAGDVNGDGFSDVIIGALYYDDSPYTNEGSAFVYYGSSIGLSDNPNSILDDCDQSNAEFGVSVASAGDVNGDGYSDVIIGAWLYDDGFVNEGKAFVYYGSIIGLSNSPNSTPDDSNKGSSGFGFSVASAGDVNGDGFSDIIIGAYLYNDDFNQEGIAFVYYGSSVGISEFPNSIPDDANQADANFGYCIASAGDVNGDGYSDVIIGAKFYDEGINGDEGRAFLYHGNSDGLSAIPVNTPDDANQAGAFFGYSVACAGDVNGDGYSDIIVGAILFDDGVNADEGRAFVYYGSAAGLSTIPNITLDNADQANANFGISVASAGDVNGDGYSDVIIGAYLYDDGANTDEGRAFVYYGSAAGLSFTPNITLDDADQAGAGFGISVASAGDVNGDGYSDVIIGAFGYDDGANTDEGRAFVYHGSATGLSSTPNSTPDDADQVSARFGFSVASAGDVNGDGYSDVIIGAYLYDDGANIDEGKAFVYYGSAIGLSGIPNSTPDDADLAGADFGISVASAGDVNGDGFSDLVIGASEYDDGANIREGRAFVYYGSAAGLSSTPNIILDGANQADARFGWSVAGAGDVNGDGYSDVIIGAYLYDDGANTDEGRAFVYQGSATGLSSTPNSTPDDADQVSARFGFSVASAGDINGDGYSDVIIGAVLYSDGANTNEGRAFVYYGNNSGGLRNNLRLYNSDLITPIQQSNMADPNLFGAGLFAKSFIGKQKGKLVWETAKNGNPFSGNPITNSTGLTAQDPTYSDLGLAGVELKHQIAKQNPTKATYIRARVKYDLVTAITGQVYGPWRYPEGLLRGRRDLGAVALPLKFVSFTAVKQAKSTLVRWITVDEGPRVYFEVQHSTDGINFSVLAVIPGKNQIRSEYEWIHTNPAKGNNFYRIMAVENQKDIYSSTRKLIFSDALSFSVYPNPAIPNQLLTIKSEAIVKGQKLNIWFLNTAGQTVWQGEIVTASDGKASLIVPVIPAGGYLLMVNVGQWPGKEKIVVVDGY